MSRLMKGAGSAKDSKSAPLISRAAKQNPAQLVLDELNATDRGRGCGFLWAVVCCLPTFGQSVFGCCDDGAGYACCVCWPAGLSHDQDVNLRSLRRALNDAADDFSGGNDDFAQCASRARSMVGKFKASLSGDYQTACDRGLQSVKAEETAVSETTFVEADALPEATAASSTPVMGQATQR